MTTPALRLPIVAGLIEIVAGTEGMLDILKGGERVGSIVVDMEGERLAITSLCVDEGLRGYGAGSTAARAMVHAATDAGCSTVRAWAPPNRGLAVYFWFRMGLRPVPGPGPDGGIWLERELRRPG